MHADLKELLATVDAMSMKVASDRRRLTKAFDLLCAEGGAEKVQIEEERGGGAHIVTLHAVLADGRALRARFDTGRAFRHGQMHLVSVAGIYIDDKVVKAPTSILTYQAALAETLAIMQSASVRTVDTISTKIDRDPMSDEIEEFEDDDIDQPIVYAGTCDRCGRLNMTSWSGRRLDGEFANGAAYDCTGYDADTDERCWHDVYIMPCTEAEYEDMKAEHAFQAERRLLEAV